MACLFLFMLPSYTMQKIPCLLLFICLFEEGSICRIYNEECSCSDFSSHALPKLLFAAVGCMWCAVPLACPENVHSWWFLSQLPLRIFCWVVWTCWSQMKTGATRRGYSFVVKKETPSRLPMSLTEEMWLYFVQIHSCSIDDFCKHYVYHLCSPVHTCVWKLLFP